MQQTYADIEMIFINDGSQDESREIVARYQDKDSRITIIDKKNGGPAMARNAGLHKAKGHYIMFCDSDDYYHPAMVSTMVTLIEEQPDIDLAMCNCKTLNAKNSLRKDKEYAFNKRNGIYDLTNYIKHQANILLWNKIFKREILCQYDIDFAKIRSHEDVNFIYKYLSVAKKINFTSIPLYHYRFHEQSLSENIRVNPAHIDEYLTCLEDVMDFMSRHDLLKQNQQYLINSISYIAFVIEKEFTQHLAKDKQSHYALRLYQLSRNIDVTSIVNEELRAAITRLATGNIAGLTPECILTHDYDEATIPLIFSVDKNYVGYLATTLQSIMENASSNRNYLIVILDCGIDYASILELEQQIENFLHFQLHVISALPFIARYQERFVEKRHFTTAIYGRLLIPEICHRFKTAIYADCDMAFNRDIAELTDLDLGSNYIAAAIDPPLEINRRIHQWWRDYVSKKLGLNETQAYVNSGLIVFNIEQWKRHQIAEHCIEELKNGYSFPDQDVINIACKGKIHYLGQEWNCTCQAKELFQMPSAVDAVNHCAFLEKLAHDYATAYYGNKTVFHYVAEQKPWAYPNTAHAEKWWHYCRRTLHYDKILQGTLVKHQDGDKQIAVWPSEKKISLFGVPIAKIKYNNLRRSFFVFGVRWLKIIQDNNNKDFYFLRFKFMRKKTM